MSTHQYDSRLVHVADGHYSRQKPGTKKCTPPGRKLLLITEDASAIWCTSWPLAQYVKREYSDAWLCSLFRREKICPIKASDLILEAVAITRWKYGTPPESGMITMIDPQKVMPVMVHGVPTFGFCYKKAGFEHVGYTKRRGLLIFQLTPARMPAPASPIGALWTESEVQSASK